MLDPCKTAGSKTVDGLVGLHEDRTAVWKGDVCWHFEDHFDRFAELLT